MKRLTLLATLAILLTASTLHAQTGIVSHRGYWTPRGSDQNTVESLRRAHDLGGLYGVEMDLRLTRDSVVILAHDAEIFGHKIAENDWKTLRDSIILRNNLRLNSLEEFLTEFARIKDLKFVCEFKARGDESADTYMVRETLRQIAQKGLADRVCYISFSLPVCKEIVRLSPESLVLYLGGNLTPPELKQMGIRGMNYNYGVYRKNPTWIPQARSLGMVVGVWTVNEPLVMYTFLPLVDLLTTDMPEAALDVCEELGITPADPSHSFEQQ